MANGRTISVGHRRGEPLTGRWTVTTWPHGDHRLVDDRPKDTATERLVWRENGILAAAPGQEYAIADRKLLMTHDEYVEANHVKPPKRGWTRRSK